MRIWTPAWQILYAYVQRVPYTWQRTNWKKNINFLHIFHFSVMRIRGLLAIHYTLCTFWKKKKYIRTHAISQRLVYACMSEFFFSYYTSIKRSESEYSFSIFIRKKHLDIKIPFCYSSHIIMLIKPRVLRIPMILLSQAYSLHTNALNRKSYFWVSKIQNVL